MDHTRLNPELLSKIISLIDLTTLEATDTEMKVVDLCNKALAVKTSFKEAVPVAAVCVYPPFVKIAKQELSGSAIKVASVAGGFPSGQTSIAIKLEEIKYALDEGADEIDMVLSRGKFLEGKFEEVGKEIRLIKEICNEKHLKVILETGELGSIENVKIASEIAIDNGADFIKTSTGKISPAAQPDSFSAMLEIISMKYNETGKKVGVKAAGGISEINDALIYYNLVEKHLGKDWLTNTLFRIGASRLLNNIINFVKENF